MKWDGDVAENDLVELLASEIECGSVLKGDQLRQAAQELYVQKCEKHGKPDFDGKEPFYHWVMSSARDFFAVDWMESLGHVGMVIAPRHVMHLTGLKLAMAQVAKMAEPVSQLGTVVESNYDNL